MTSEYEWFSIRITKVWSYAGIAVPAGGDGLGDALEGEGPVVLLT
jgi:hypothetical protein